MLSIDFLFYIPLAILPSLIWLLFYLREDKHPEPKSMVLKVFIWGMLIAFPVVIIENVAIDFLEFFSLPETLRLAILYLVIVAITEEVMKFLAVYSMVFKRTTEMDEPVDAMIYMIIAALGFAAIENVFLLTPLSLDNFPLALNITTTRFFGATFLHALASAIIGYYFALYLSKPKKRFPLLIHGFTLAILLHGFYNIFVVHMEDNFLFVFPTALLILSTAIAISIFIKKLLRIKSISV